MRVIMLVEDDPKHGQLIKQWIAEAIPDVTVSWHHNPREAEKALLGYKKTDIVKCIVLDMFFESSFMKTPQPLGEDLLYRYPEIPSVLISENAATRDYIHPGENVPLLQLDKPQNLLPAGNPGVQLEVEEFRRDLVKAVKCGLLVGSLRAEVAHLKGKQVFRPFLSMRVAWAAVPFIGACVLYGASSLYHVPDWLQHFLLTLCAVIAVHLLDRTVLFKDFRDAFDSVRMQVAELALAIQQNAQEREDRLLVAKKLGEDETR